MVILYGELTDEQRAKNKAWDEAAEKEARVKAELGSDARVVPPYKPNRKQRRAQEARRRAKEKK